MTGPQTKVQVEMSLDVTARVTEELYSFEDELVLKAKIKRHGGGNLEPATNLDIWLRSRRRPSANARGGSDRPEYLSLL